MKLSFKKKIHNCNKHIKQHTLYAGWNEPEGVNGFEEYCSICGRIKNYEEYGSSFIINYKPKEYKIKGDY